MIRMRTLILLLALVLPAFAADAPRISADLGSCSADFHVVDASAKPIYNARIHSLVRSGAFGLRKLDLEIRTDSDGNASIVGLPEVPKRPITFDISNGTATTSIPFEPDKQCKAKFDVTLK
ncbi:MAG: hypothetical protein ACM3JB_15355 [Acidobacteriaceae bacterium]